MVQVRAEHPVNQDGTVDIDAWIERIQQRVPLPEPQQLKQACEWAAQLDRDTSQTEHRWANGASSYRTGLEMAEILADLKLDQESLVAAAIDRAVREQKTTAEDVRLRLRDEVAELVDGGQRMAAISISHNPSGVKAFNAEYHVDYLRRMLFTMLDDVHVALIMLAGRAL